MLPDDGVGLGPGDDVFDIGNLVARHDREEDWVAPKLFLGVRRDGESIVAGRVPALAHDLEVVGDRGEGLVDRPQLLVDFSIDGFVEADPPLPLAQRSPPRGSSPSTMSPA